MATSASRTSGRSVRASWIIETEKPAGEERREYSQAGSFAGVWLLSGSRPGAPVPLSGKSAARPASPTSKQRVRHSDASALAAHSLSSGESSLDQQAALAD
jgi:hypothetical protein